MYQQPLRYMKMLSTKHMQIFRFILLFGILSITQLIQAQIIVTPARSASNTGETPGFYYSLPRNLIKVDFIVERNRCLKGPYSEYATKLLGISDFIQKDEIKYSIIDAIISVVTEPDPDATYYVEFDEKASKEPKSLIFNLQDDGIILSANDAETKGEKEGFSISKTLVNSDKRSEFQYYAESNLYQKVDTIVRKITIDTTTIRRNILQSSWVDRSPEQKARSAADYIHKIRESRFNLISGYQEVNYGNSIAYMDEKLLLMEEEYVSLFTGKQIKTLEEQSIEFLPLKENIGQQPLIKFNETTGFTPNDAKTESVIIEINPVGNGANIAASNKNNGNSKIMNNLYCRVPEYALIKIIYKGKVLSEEKLLISQLGSLAIAPVTKTRLVFDAKTGMVTTVKRD
jgi:hypothetical protein